MGTFQITEELGTTAAGKYSCMVSFNGHEPQYYEIESDGSELTEEYVNSVLQQVADDSVGLS